MSLTARSRPLQARRPRGSGLWPALVLLLCLTSNAATPLKDQPHLRRPVAAAWIEPGKLLAVANSRSGSVSIVDIPARKVLDEIRVGERLSSIAALGRGRWFLALDEKRHELLVLRWSLIEIEVAGRIPTGHYPIRVVVSPDGATVVVGSLWSRQVALFGVAWQEADQSPSIRSRGQQSLPFNPRELVFLADNRHVVVADAFGGSLALIDVRSAQLQVNPSDASAISGLALSHDRAHLFVAHERREKLFGVPYSGKVQRDKQPRFYVEVSWLLRKVPVSNPSDISLAFLRGREPNPSVIREYDGHLRAIAVLGPTFTARFDRGGTTVEIDNGQFSRSIPVPLGPIQIVPSSSGEPHIVVSHFADALTLLEPKRATLIATIRLGRTPSKSPSDRGEEFFYSLHINRTALSCHSCHTDGHTSGQLADTLGDGTDGTPKRIPTLLGTRLTDPWAWNGQVRSLNEQVRKSLETTMHKTNFTPQQVDDITAFLHTLPPPPPPQPATDEREDKAQLARGSQLFNRLGCVKCHVPPLTYTSSDVYDVGLEDEKGLRKFNPPSLRGVSQGYAFFHDGRAKSLEEVFTVHGHQLDRTLEKNELADLLRFLRSL